MSAKESDGSGGRQAIRELLGDRYEIRSKLGAGAFGEVYEASDTTLGRAVAIKRIRLDAFAEGEQLEEVKARFLREAQVAAKLRHPNIVTVHDIAAQGASSFMVMERVEGTTLQALLRERGRLPLDEALGILSQAAAALDHAHASGVVHRDVKPANLMLEPSGVVKVMDFGIAKAAASGDVTRTGAILGTPNYMSPEQARGQTLDGRSDQFSLGCVLYECLTGQRPFGGDSITAILLNVVNENPPPMDFDALELPRPIGAVLERALAKRAADRHATCSELIRAAREAASGAAVPTVRSPRAAVAPPPVPAAGAPAAPLPRTSSRRTAAIAAGVVLAAGAAAALVWTARASQRAAPPARPPGSSNVTLEAPGFVAGLLGARPKLHVTVPEGSTFSVRLETPLSSETARAGDRFTAASTAPIAVEGVEVVPAGSQVVGHVAHAAPSGKVSGRGELTLEFDRIVTPDGGEFPIEAAPQHRRARATVKKDAAKVGGAAGVGVIVGGILGGRKGAAIGGAAGGAAGAGAVLATKGEEAVFGAGSPLEVRLRAPFSVTLDAPPQ
jgi:tRNA A-37 threonylcarbamoyl transferase component Bud32